jgi:glycine betaine catabolism B
MINQITYQGLFYFVTAFSTFSIILLTLRSLSLKKECEQAGTHNLTHCWHTKEQLEIVEIIEETHDIKSFRFKRLGDLKLDKYLAGQFLSFQIGDDPKTLRSYSLSSTCENESILQVSIKHLADGLGSGWFHSLKKGEKVWAFPPHGLFTDDNLKNEDRIYIAGGIGITPVLSMILTGLDRSTEANRYLFYGIKSTKDMAFHSMLEALSKRFSHFDYFPIISDDDSWSGDKGYLTLDFF